jgi:hypothetical protein
MAAAGDPRMTLRPGKQAPLKSATRSQSKCSMNIQAVAERNNLGVAHLDAGDMKSALSHFSEALNCTMRDLEDPVEVAPVVGWDSNGGEEGSSVAQEMVFLPHESDYYVQEKSEDRPASHEDVPRHPTVRVRSGNQLDPLPGSVLPRSAGQRDGRFEHYYLQSVDHLPSEGA